MNQPPSNSFYSSSTGTSSTSPFIELFSERDPNENDTQFAIQQRWFNVNNNVEWILVSFSSLNATLTANWKSIFTTSEALLEFTGGTGTTGSFPVFPKPTNPDAGSIQLITTTNAAALTILGGTNSLTFSLSSIPTLGLAGGTGTTGSFPVFPNVNTGIITLNTTSSPLANRLSIVGGANSVTLSLLATPVIQYVDGSGFPGTWPVNPSGSGLISITSNAGSIIVTGSTSNLNFDIAGFTGVSTYSPVVTSSGGAVTATYGGFQVGRFSVTNGICTVSFNIAGNISAAAAGDCRISLPLPCVVLANHNDFGSGYFSLNGDTNIYTAAIQVANGNSFVTIHQYVASAPGPVNAPISTGDFNLQGTITYFVS